MHGSLTIYNAVILIFTDIDNVSNIVSALTNHAFKLCVCVSLYLQEVMSAVMVEFATLGKYLKVYVHRAYIAQGHGRYRRECSKRKMFLVPKWSLF